MLVLLFAFQGDVILAQPFVIALLAVPILIQVPLMLLVVRAVNASRPWYEAGPAMPAARVVRD